MFSKGSGKKLVADFNEIDKGIECEEKKPKPPQSEDGKRSNGVKKLSKQDEFSSIVKSDSSSSDVEKLNRIHKAYERNIKRVERVNPGFKLEKIPFKGNFRFLSQQLAAYKGSLGKDTLRTPFGEATIQFNEGRNSIDKAVIGPIPTKYEDIVSAIDNVLRNDKLEEFYNIILDYLEIPADDKYANKTMSDIKDIVPNKFFDDKNNFKKDSIKKAINKAKRAAISLCAISMISESTKNRLFEGNKVFRGLFRKCQKESIDDKISRFPSSKEGGAEESRNVREMEFYPSSEWETIGKEVSESSNDEQDNLKDISDKLKENIRSRMEEFLNGADIAQLQQMADIMGISI